jgi:hypothetical protein
MDELLGKLNNLIVDDNPSMNDIISGFHKLDIQDSDDIFELTERLKNVSINDNNKIVINYMLSLLEKLCNKVKCSHNYNAKFIPKFIY